MVELPSDRDDVPARIASSRLTRRHLLRASATVATASMVSFAGSAEIASAAPAPSVAPTDRNDTAPVVFTIQNASVEAGDALQVNGAGFKSITQARLLALPRQRTGTSTEAPKVPTKLARSLPVASAAPDSLVTVVPADMGHRVLALYLSNDGHTWSTPFLYNAPVAWYLDRKTAEPGASIRIVGTDLALAGTAQVWLCSHGQLTACDASSSSRYSAVFAVPTHMPPGDYSVVLDNGAARTEAGTISVVKATSPDNMYDVTAFGADPSGAADSTKAISAALQSAAQSHAGAVVRFPAGIYAVSSKITVPAGAGPIVLKGAGVAKTTLTMTPDAPFSPDLVTGRATDAYSVGPDDELSLVYLAAGDSAVTVTGMTLDTAGKRFAALGLNGRNNVTVDSVTLVCDSYPQDIWLFEGTTAIFALNNHDLDVKNSTMRTSTGITLINTVDIRISGNKFLLFFPREKGAPNNPENGAGDRGIRGWGCKRVTIDGNAFRRGSDKFYYGGAVLFGAQKVLPTTFGPADAAFVEDIYIGGNSVLDAGEPGSNDGEVFVGDQENGMPGTHVVLPVVSATPLTAEFADGTFATNDAARDASGTYVMILGGTGAGQVRRVVSNTSAQLMLELPWDVIPDSTSRVVVTLAHVRHAYVNNRATNCPKYVGMYGSAISVHIADNEIDSTGAPDPNAKIGGDTGCAFHAILDANSQNPSLYPVFYNQIVRNELTTAFAFVQGLAWATPPGNTPVYPMARSNVLAHNIASNADASAALFTSTNGNTPADAVWGRYNVVARNSPGVGTAHSAIVGPSWDVTVIQQGSDAVDQGSNSVRIDEPENSQTH